MIINPITHTRSGSTVHGQASTAKTPAKWSENAKQCTRNSSCTSNSLQQPCNCDTHAATISSLLKSRTSSATKSHNMSVRFAPGTAPGARPAPAIVDRVQELIEAKIGNFQTQIDELKRQNADLLNELEEAEQRESLKQRELKKKNVLLKIKKETTRENA